MRAHDLPVGSVVATSTDVFIRVTDYGWHGACSDGGQYGLQSGFIDDLITAGATVLRVGTGTPSPEPSKYWRANRKADGTLCEHARGCLTCVNECEAE